MTESSGGTVAPLAGRTGFVDGFLCGLRALLAKEVRGRGRGWRPAAVLTGYLLALTTGVAGFLALAGRSAIGSSPWLGLQLFSMLALGAVLLIAFVTTSLTTGLIAGERERRTLDLLLVTRASPLGLVAGKLAGALLYVFFLLIASLPAFALVYLFGGVPPEYLLVVFAIAGATAIAHASLGLVLSALLRRTIVASVVAYLVVIGLVFGLPFAATVARTNGTVTEMTGWTGYAPNSASFAMGSMVYLDDGRDPFANLNGPPAKFTYASPLVALSSALPTGSVAASGLPLVDEVLQLVVGGALPIGAPGEGFLRAVYLVSMDLPAEELDTTEVWAPWLYYVGGSLATAPLAVLLAGAVLAPRRRWRAPWSRNRHAR